MLAATPVLADVSEEVSFSYELAPGGRVSLTNINGEVTIEGGGDRVEIVAFKSADDDESLEAIEIVIDARDDLVRIETRHPKRKGWFGGWDNGGATVDYRLTIPEDANVDAVESVNGDVRISGVRGKVKAETVNGAVDVDGASSDIRLATVNGSVSARFEALGGDQRVDCESVNGRIELDLPDSASASVSVDTVNGGIDADDFGLEADKGFVGRSLEGVIGDGSARISANTVNGAVKIRKR
jgi:hypothetical protein